MRGFRFLGMGGNFSEDTTPPIPPFINGYSMTFNGVDQYLDGGNVHAFERTDPFTISTWFKPNGSSICAVVSKRDATQSVGYVILPRPSINVWVIQILDNTGHLIDLRGAFTWSSLLWYHLVLTYDGSSSFTGTNFYINGTLLVPGSASGSLVTSIVTADPFTIMKDGSASLYAPGKSDETSMWNAALNATQIGQIYNGGAAGDISLLSFYGSKCISWYHEGDPPDTSGLVNDVKGTFNLTGINSPVITTDHA